MPTTLVEVVLVARELRTDADDSNPEYDRALVEMACDLVPGWTTERKEEMAELMGIRLT